jgi:ABC-type transport system substrate-binding protein
MAQIKQRGFTIYSNAQPHVWPWQLSFAEGSPWVDKRVRQAANLCVDRAGLKSLLGDMMEIPKGTFPPGHPWWGNPSFEIKYDPAAAKKLMTDAGYSTAKPMKTKVQISASGSGQMMPLPMNEFVQQSLKQWLFDIQFDVIEWNTMFNSWRLGAKDPAANGATATNVSFSAMDPFFAMVRFSSTKAFPPVSNNWGYFGSPEIEQLVTNARTNFDEKGRVRIDDWEMMPEIQKAVFDIWPLVTTETLDQYGDFAGYQSDFLKNFGFGLAGVDYDAPTEVERPIEDA